MRLKRLGYMTGKLGFIGIAGLCVVAGIGCRGVVSSGTGEDEGKLGLWVTDPGVSELDRLEITITAVDIKRLEDTDPIRIELDRPLMVDLTRVAQRRDGREKLFDRQALPLGRYEWIELQLDETRLFVEDDGSQFPLVIVPPADPDAETGLRLNFNASVDDETNLDLTIDFNIDKTLRDRGNDTFEFQPNLRLVRTERTGTLDGLVAEALVRDSRCNNGTSFDQGNRVYVYNGIAHFQDIQGNENDPIATVPVTRSTSGDDYEFTMRFLPQGNYTAVFTCDRSLDDPEADNTVEMQISELQSFSITAGQTTSLFFEF